MTASPRSITRHLDVARHPVGDPAYAASCRSVLEAEGALVLPGFVGAATVAQLVAEFSDREREAYYTRSTHNVYLTPPDPRLAGDHPYNRQVASSKGLLADDQLPADSPLREIYDDETFRAFLASVPVTRLLVVFAYNSDPGVGLSASALETFYGRTS